MKSAVSIAPAAATKWHISYRKNCHIRFFRLWLVRITLYWAVSLFDRQHINCKEDGKS